MTFFIIFFGADGIDAFSVDITWQIMSLLNTAVYLCLYLFMSFVAVTPVSFFISDIRVENTEPV